MRTLDFDTTKQKFIFSFDYEPKIIEAIKDTIPGRQYVPDQKHWVAPTSSVKQIVKLASRFDFNYSGISLEMITSLTKHTQQNIKESQSAQAEITIPGLNGELRPFQKAGVSYMIRNKQVLLGDEMGLGKTVQAIAAIHSLSAYPCLVICPASLKLNWEREFNKWLPNKETWIMDKEFEPRHDAGAFPDVCIINYDRLNRFEGIIENMGFQGLICDESHYLKNGSAKRTQAVKKIAKHIDYKFLLTGTPVLNNPYELISQLQILGKLDEFGGWAGFTGRYCGQRNHWGGFDRSNAKNLEELNEKLRSLLFVRRIKKDVLKELPDKQRVIVPIDITNRKSYEKAKANLIKFIYDTVLLETQDPIRAYMKADNARRAEIIVGITTLKKVAAYGKIKQTCEWLSNFKETGEKLVIFAHHKQVISKIQEWHEKEYGTKMPEITGSTSITKRQEAVDAFQNNPTIQFIILNIKAGGVGLTLTAASNVLFLELDWTPAAHDQAEDRCHRIGQKDNVTAYYLLGEKTIDMDIYQVIQEKRGIVNQITGDKELTKVKQSSVAEIMKRLLEKET